MNDPANLPFMEAIMRGQLPAELDPGDPGVQVGRCAAPSAWPWLCCGLARP